ncbi:hypothetical protein D3C76_1471340 [compost metagenome]
MVFGGLVQAVAAQQVGVAGLHLHAHRLQFKLVLDADGAGDDVAARVHAGFGLVEQAAVLQLLDVAVVMRQALDAAIAQPI